MRIDNTSGAKAAAAEPTGPDAPAPQSPPVIDPSEGVAVPPWNPEFLFHRGFRAALDMYIEVNARVNTITALQATYGVYGEDQQHCGRTPDQVPPYLTIRFNEAMDDLETVEVTFEDALAAMMEEEIQKRITARELARVEQELIRMENEGHLQSSELFDFYTRQFSRQREKAAPSP